MAACFIDSRDKFKNLYFSLISLNYDGSQNQRHILNALLDDLNSLDFKSLIVPDYTYGSQLILSCIQQVPHSDCFLAAKSSRLIVNLIARQKISLSIENIESAFQWFLSALKDCSDIVLCDILEGLAVILKGNANYLKKYHKHLVDSDGLLINLINTKASSFDTSNPLTSPFEITLLVVKCFESFVSISEDTVVKATDDPCISEAHLNQCGEVFLQCLYRPISKSQDEQNYCKILATCMSGCRFIVIHPTDWCSVKLGEILGVARTHMLRGLLGYEHAIPQKVLQSQQPVPEVSNNSARIGKGGKVSRIRKQRNASTKKPVGGAGDATGPNNEFYLPSAPELIC